MNQHIATASAKDSLLPTVEILDASKEHDDDIKEVGNTVTALVHMEEPPRDVASTSPPPTVCTSSNPTMMSTPGETHFSSSVRSMHIEQMPVRFIVVLHLWGLYMF